MTLLPTNFRPMTTQPSKCSKLKVRIYFDSTIFQAGGTIFGRMEITATSSRSLKLGEIAVELAAYEELASRECTATQSFLSSRLCFQGNGIPPSNAVYGLSDENGFFMARKGKTTFPFAFQLPLDCPSSLIFGATASLRYVVTGLVQIYYHGKEELVAKSKEAFVVEAWDGYNAEHRMPVRASNSTKLFWGGTGSLELEAVLPETLHSAGGNLSVEIRVRNNTARKVQGVRLGVARQLIMVADKEKAEQNPHLKIDTTSVSETVGTQEYKTSTYLFDPGEERIMTLNMAIPINARTIRGTALFEVTCSVVISMLLGAFSGELSVELPVKICHPASLTPAPKPTFLSNQYNLEDGDFDVASDSGRGAIQETARRVGSTSSQARPISPQRGRDFEGSVGGGAGDGEQLSQQQYPQGDHEDDRQLSPANSITSIRSILSKSSKLSKLADRIGRSTSPTAVSHRGIENDPKKRATQKSTPLGPAQPIAYVPAVERVRYTPFQAPPTAKAKEFLKAATDYQNQLGLSGVLEGYEDREIDLADGAMATAIHDWLARKEADTAGAELQRGRSRLKKRGGITANRQLKQDDDPWQDDQEGARRTSPRPIPISTSPHSRQPRSPSFGSPVDDSPRGDLWSQQASPTTSGSFAIPITTRRAPAAPQTEAYGSAPEDSIVTPPLFHRPLPCPLPSPPPNASPTRPGDRFGGPLPAAASSATSTSSIQPQTQSQARARSPSPVLVQTPENIQLAREAFERVKRMSSPVRDSFPSSSHEEKDRLPPRSSRLSGQPITGSGTGSLPEGAGSVPRSAAPRGPAAIVSEECMTKYDQQDFAEPAVAPELLKVAREGKIKVPVPTLTGSQQSALSKLLRDAAEDDQDDPSPSLPHDPSASTTGPFHETVAPATVVPPERDCKTPELSHVPMNRPLPAPKAKPKPDNLRQQPREQNVSSLPPQTHPMAAQHPAAPVPAPRPSRAPQPQPTYPVPPSASLAAPRRSPNPNHVVNKQVAASQSGHRVAPLPAPAAPHPMPQHQRAISPPRAPVAMSTTRTKVHPLPPPRTPATIVPATTKKPVVDTTRKPMVTPVPAARPAAASGTTTTKSKNIAAATTAAPLASSSSPPSGGPGFVYPKTARKPVAAPKPPGMTAAATAAGGVTTNLKKTGPSSSSSMVVGVGAGATSRTSPGAVPLPPGTRVADPAVTRGPFVAAEEPTVIRSRSPLREQLQQQQQQQQQPQVCQHEQPGRRGVESSPPSQQQSAGADHGQQVHHSHPQDNHHHHDVDQDPYGFRAPPIAMANSIRVQGMMTGPSSSASPPGGAFVGVAAVPPSSAPSSSSPSSSSASQGQSRYAVNTTVLRQAIGAPPRQSNSSGSGGNVGGNVGGGNGGHPARPVSSGHGSMADLFQGAKNVASAAVAGLGWRQDSHPPQETKGGGAGAGGAGATGVPSSAAAVAVPRSSSPPSSSAFGGPNNNRNSRPLGIEPLPRSALTDRPLQHDLTMKDIDFQTVREVMLYPQTFSASSSPSTSSPLAASSSSPISSTASPSSASKAAYPLPPPVLDPTAKVSSPPPKSTATAAVARATSPARASAHSRPDSLSADVNLDKTLPKIHENAASRLELQAEKRMSAAAAVLAPPALIPSTVEPLPRQKSPPAFSPNTNTPAATSSSSPSSPSSPSRPPRATMTRSTSPSGNAMARNGLRVGLTAHHGHHHHHNPPASPGSAGGGGGGGGGSGAGAKAVNPRLQEYIQKYNLAANARG
ncbi:hypothetical protein DFQ27_005719 [Actinomortierella ambigua]|uniref:Arrestin C-terminal-like domain-containing protein n=1 Tax=Actinomortierella ambigua TaxID=1343610 RepID=A0A9P6QL31_9FUNG|nr:hypothetical protein DFQ27_005719 [Actinomortierella ambigua]